MYDEQTSSKLKDFIMSTIATINGSSSVNHPAALAVMKMADSVNFGNGEYTLGYNENSGFYYAYSEDECLQIGIADYCFHRGEEVEYILSCPETGEELFSSDLTDLANQYLIHCNSEDIEMDERLQVELTF